MSYAEYRQPSKQELIEQRLDKTCRQVKSMEIFLTLTVLITCGLGYLILFALLDHWAFQGGVPSTLRLAWFAVGILVAGFYLLRRFLPLVLYSVNPIYAAKILEEHRPSMKNSLINWIFLRRDAEQRQSELKASGQKASTTTQNVYQTRMIEQVAKQTANDLEHVPSDMVVDHSPIIRWGFVLLALVVFICLYALFSPKSPLPSFARLMFPFSRISAPTRVRFVEIKPGDATVAQGETITVSAHIDGARKTPVYLYYTTDDRRMVDQIVPMSIPEGNYKYECRFPPGKSGFEQGISYYIGVGAEKSQSFRFDVQQPYLLEARSLTCKYPAYTGVPDAVVQGTGDIRAVEGTQVIIHAKSNFSLKNGVFVPNGEERESKALTIVPSDPMSANVAIWLAASVANPAKPEYQSYVLRGYDSEGNTNRNPSVYRVEMLKDQPPTISWIDPPEDQLSIPQNGYTEALVSAEDADFGIRYLRFHFDVENHKIAPVDLLKSPASGPTEFTGKVSRGFKIQPDQLRLNVGDVVEYWAEAVDTKLPQGNSVITRRLSFVVAAPKPGADQKDANQERQEQKEKEQEQEKQEQQEQQQEQQDKQEQQQQEPGQEEDESKSQDADESNESGETDSAEEKQSENNEGKDGESKDSQEKDKEKDGKDGENGESEKDQKEGQKGEADSQNQQGGEQQNQGDQKDNQQGGQDQQGDPQGNQGDQGGQQGGGAQDQGGKDDQKGGGESESGEAGGSSTPNSQSPNPNSQQGGGQSQNSDEQSGFQPLSDDNSGTGEGTPENGPGAEQQGNQKGKTPSGDQQQQNPNSQSPNSNSQSPNLDGESQPGDVFDKVLERMKKEGKETDPNKADPDKADPNAPRQRSDDLDPESDQRTDKGTAPKDVPQKTAKEKPGEKTQKAYTTADDQNAETTEKADPNKPILNDPKKDNAGQPSDEPGQESGLKGGEGGKQQQEQPGDEKPSDSGQESGKGEQPGQGEQSEGGGESGESQSAQGQQQSGKGEKSEKGQQSNGQQQSEGDQQSGGGEQQSGKGGQSEPGGENQSEPGEAGGSGSSSPHPPSPIPHPQAGGTGNQGPGDFGDDSMPEHSDPNLDFAQKQTSLVLKYLEEEMSKSEPNPELLKDLGWSKDELQAFLKKWQAMSEGAQKAAPGSHEDQKWKEALKSLGTVVPTRSTSVKARTTNQDQATATGSLRVQPPKNLKERFEQYNREISK